MICRKTKHIIPFFLCTLMLLFSSNFNMSVHAEEEEFDPGEYIMGHITDDYGWHITTFNDHHISIPLHVILFDDGLVSFSSSKFHHGHQAYKGYALGFTKETDGTIVKLGGNYSEYT